MLSYLSLIRKIGKKRVKRGKVSCFLDQSQIFIHNILKSHILKDFFNRNYICFVLLINQIHLLKSYVNNIEHFFDKSLGTYQF